MTSRRSFKSSSPDDLPTNLTGFWRLCEIHRLVSQGTYPNCNTLAAHFEVHRRTIERDIERLKYLFGAPIEYDPSHRGYHYTEQFSLPAMRLREGEAVALFLGQKFLMECRGTPFEEFIRQAMAKIRMSLPREVEVSLERAINAVSFHVDPLRGEEIEVAETYRLLVSAIQQQRTVEMDYYSAGSDTVTRRKVDPYHLRFVDGAWYCIGFCHTRNEVRTFALDRMMNVSMTAHKFDYPEDFSLEDYLASSWIIERGEPTEVVIEFDAEEAKYVRGRKWHSSQRLEQLEDGSVRLSFFVGGMGEIMRWIMSFGRHARVVKPKELRDRIVRELELALRSYGVGSETH
ncbi:MAG: transcriptional regulator [Candidatus Fermentithermobacillus carboniphilus]|uniref:Transcriptional regulator n=1 Tax=Candidatus Fermentithermobacillus carboniphilus TaxID=3085328 RepID=A0AAT9LBI5_9FIRM|nr:MAG: transcriptional regulator [Candidatus Fermentithermobacillus carboniphilus]